MLYYRRFHAFLLLLRDIRYPVRWRTIAVVASEWSTVHLR
jgi:hypothetical protein